MSDKKEYIEREAVLNKQMEICHWDGLNDSYDDFVAVKDILAIPAADVKEVRHGKWAWYPNRMDRQELLCTNCEESAPYNEDGERVMTPFCPNCGAEMDGGK